MKLILLSNGEFTKVDDEDFEWLSDYKWMKSNKGYVTITIPTSRCSKFMHKMIMNTPIGLETDHINQDKLDNRRCNLRICTTRENQANSKIRVDNTSGYRGVNYLKKYKKWAANIRINGKKKYIGWFDSAEEAARAYDKFLFALYGNICTLNFKEVE